jgi:hypothetical protein
LLPFPAGCVIAMLYVPFPAINDVTSTSTTPNPTAPNVATTGPSITGLVAHVIDSGQPVLDTPLKIPPLDESFTTVNRNRADSTTAPTGNPDTTNRRNACFTLGLPTTGNFTSPAWLAPGSASYTHASATGDTVTVTPPGGTPPAVVNDHTTGAPDNTFPATSVTAPDTVTEYTVDAANSPTGSNTAVRDASS